MTAKELPILWIENEIRLQERRLRVLKQSEDAFKKVTGYNLVVEMREEMLTLAKNKLWLLKNNQAVA